MAEPWPAGSRDKTVRLWDTATGKLLRTLEGHSAEVNAVVYSPDGRTLASGSNDKTVRLWDLTSLQLLYPRTTPSPFAAVVSEALQLLWEQRFDGLEIKPASRKPALLPQQGYYLTYDPKFRSLLDPPAPGETKFDQVLRWAEQQAGQRGGR